MTRYEDLLGQLAGGGREAMDRLLGTAQSLAYRFGVLVCGNVPDAEDAMQDALLQTYRRAKGIRNPHAFRTWLYRTVRNACLMSRRSQARQPLRLLPLDDDAFAVAATGQTPEELTAAAAERRRVHQALQSLPETYRLVVFLRDIEGLSTAEAARIVGISRANVKQRLHRARVMLKEALTQSATAPVPASARSRAPLPQSAPSR